MHSSKNVLFKFTWILRYGIRPVNVITMTNSENDQNQESINAAKMPFEEIEEQRNRQELAKSGNFLKISSKFDSNRNLDLELDRDAKQSSGLKQLGNLSYSNF